MQTVRAALLLLALVGCDERSSTSATNPAGAETSAGVTARSVVAIEGDAARGHELVRRFECARCHAVPGEPDPPLEKQCVGCHAAIEGGTFEAPPAVLEEWRGRLHSLPAAPSLAVARHLLRPSWIAAYLREPHDLRPHLEATMPRLAISERQARDVAAFLAGADDPAAPIVSPDGLAKGRALFVDKGCGGCHAFGGSGAPHEVVDRRAVATVLAPDLRFTRARVRADRLAAWIADPTAVPGSHMPALALSRDEAAALASFVMHAPLREVEESAPPPRLSLLDRPVGYDEVRERVFQKVCWHCHAQPDLARGDGGPGMSGGFGFAPRRLDLSTYEAIASGYLDDDGEVQSLFAGDPPRLLAVLLARQREARGEHGELRGMPLGLPPSSPEDIQLVESWIAQGRPR